MNSISKWITALLFVSLLMATGPVLAQSKQPPLKPPVVVMLDTQEIQRTSAAGKSLQVFVDARRKLHKSRLVAEEKILRKEWDELTRQRSILAPQAYQQRERAFRTKETAAKRKVAALEQALNYELRVTLAAVSKILDQKMRPILDKIVKAKGIDIIMMKQSLVYVGVKYNITAEVLQEVDKSLPTLDVEAVSLKAKKKQKKKK
jgi:Skp family chaperone for outer membrane proteins